MHTEYVYRNEQSFVWLFVQVILFAFFRKWKYWPCTRKLSNYLFLRVKVTKDQMFVQISNDHYFWKKRIKYRMSIDKEYKTCKDFPNIQKSSNLQSLKENNSVYIWNLQIDLFTTPVLFSWGLLSLVSCLITIFKFLKSS